MVERLQTTEATEAPADRARQCLCRALLVIGLAATIGSAGPTVTPTLAANSRLQKATTQALDSFATQILTDYQRASPDVAAPDLREAQLFYNSVGYRVIYWFGANYSGPSYLLDVAFTVPKNPRHVPPPKSIKLSNIREVTISESFPDSGFGPSFSYGPSYEFTAVGNYGNGKGQWEVGQELSSTTPQAGPDVWSYVTPGYQGGHRVHAPLTTHELQTMTSQARIFLHNARQHVVTPITAVLGASLPPPTQHFPPLEPPGS